MIRIFVAPLVAIAVATSLVAFADPAVAQPGKGFEKGKGKGFDKGGPGGGDAVKTLEAELAKLKSLEADLESKLKQLKGPAPKQPAGPGPGGFGRPGGFGPPAMGGFGPPMPFGWGKEKEKDRGPGSFGPPGGWGERGGSKGAFPGAVQGVVRAASGLSAEQLKEVIAALQKLQSEKQRAAAPTPRSSERPGYRPEGGRPEGRPAPKTESRPSVSNAQILERLDRLARELDEIRRAVRK
ncbi:MAG: hypothetical protein C0467_15950 [Planctomycetaceae bacterium]|nr:hypothetical protein [Planctomycetaceae bacterium]